MMKRPFRAAAVQYQHEPGDKSTNLAAIARFARQAADDSVELLCMPEMCVTGYWHVRNLSRNQIEELAEPVPDGPACQQLLDLARQHQIIIGAGLIERGRDDRLYNAYVLAMPDGSHVCHRKLHCFISEHMACGDSFTVTDTPLGRIGILTCYDNNIVENARITALHGAEILLAPHQTGGCHSRSPRGMKPIPLDLWHNRAHDPDALRQACQGPSGRQWLMRWLPARAHDNGLFLIFSNGVGQDDDEVRTGGAMILDPYGETLSESTSLENDMITAVLDPAERDQCTGVRWMAARRPELYAPLGQPTGRERSMRTARFASRVE